MTRYSRYFGLFFTLLAFFPSHSYAFCLLELSCQTLPPGVYAGAVGGINGGYHLKCKKALTNRGYYLGAKVGKNFFSFIRLEEEVLWQTNTVHSFKFGTIQLDDVKGDVNIWSLMTNAYFDFDCGLPMKPSIGGGVGYALLQGHWSGNLTQTENFLTNKQRLNFTYHKRGVAWQFIAGLNFAICPCFEAGFEYRYFKMESRISNHKLGLVLTNYF